MSRWLGRKAEANSSGTAIRIDRHLIDTPLSGTMEPVVETHNFEEMLPWNGSAVFSLASRCRPLAWP